MAPRVEAATEAGEVAPVHLLASAIVHAGRAALAGAHSLLAVGSPKSRWADTLEASWLVETAATIQADAVTLLRTFIDVLITQGTTIASVLAVAEGPNRAFGADTTVVAQAQLALADMLLTVDASIPWRALAEGATLDTASHAAAPIAARFGWLITPGVGCRRLACAATPRPTAQATSAITAPVLHTDATVHTWLLLPRVAVTQRSLIFFTMLATVSGCAATLGHSLLQYTQATMLAVVVKARVVFAMLPIWQRARAPRWASYSVCTVQEEVGTSG